MLSPWQAGSAEPLLTFQLACISIHDHAEERGIVEPRYYILQW